MKPALSWPGGKTRLLSVILPLIEKHTCYVEPFAGGLAVLLAKPRSQLEVINDVNGDLVSFYRCVKYHCDPLLVELEFVLNSREEFVDFRTQAGLTDIQRAARWYYRNKLCFGGTDMKSFGVAALGGGGAYSSRQARMERIRALSFRLDKVCIEKLDWQRCLELYDRPTTFFFVDPPYTGGAVKLYEAWTVTDLRILRERLDRLRGRWLVTINDTAENRAVFDGCSVKSVARAKGINAKATDRVYRELIVTPPTREGE